MADDVAYAQTVEAAVAKEAGAKDKPPSVVIIKNFEDEPRQVVVFEGEITAEALQTFVQSEKLPLVIPFVDKNQEKIFDSGIDKQILVIGKKEDLSGEGKLIKVCLTAIIASWVGLLLHISSFCCQWGLMTALLFVPQCMGIYCD